jgi:hypothetical protein
MLPMIRPRLPHKTTGNLTLLRTLIVAAILPTGLCAARPVDSPSAVAEPSSASDATQVALIDRLIRQGWTDSGLKPSAAAADGQWCRRVYLDLVGRIPTVAELTAYTKDRSHSRRAKLVDRLLGDEYAEPYARYWATWWTNLLVGRTGGTSRRDQTSRAGLLTYLRQSLTEHKPYDRMVHELITATGGTAPGSDGFDGATNFLAGKLTDRAVQATAKTAEIFLGIQVECTQCHNHPFNNWKQSQFWQLNAFFRQTRLLRTYAGTEVTGARLVNEDFAGEGGDPEEAEVYYELRNGLLKVAYPVFVDGTALTDILGEKTGNHGYIADVNRRAELAKLVVAADDLDQAIANRMWAHFFGYGFTRPVDDRGPHNPPSHPELLEHLGKSFRQSGFDLRRLARWIVLSEAYSLSSRTSAGNQTDDPTLGKKPQFSHFYLRQMEAEQLYESLIAATEVDRTHATEAEQDAAREKWLEQFVKAFGTDDGAETTTFNGTIPQSLMMFNGDLVRRATGIKAGSFLYRVATSPAKNNLARINRLYLAALARRAAAEEIRAANELFVQRSGNLTEALQDVWWALLNSNEFILNH